MGARAPRGSRSCPTWPGERTPHADPDARGAFTGLSLRHDRGALVRAVLEGVAFGLRDSLDLVAEMGGRARRRPRLGRRRAQRPVAADRGLGAGAAAGAHGGRRGRRVRRGPARRGGRRGVDRRGGGGGGDRAARPAWSSRWRSGSSPTARAASASGRCIRRSTCDPPRRVSAGDAQEDPCRRVRARLGRCTEEAPWAPTPTTRRCSWWPRRSRAAAAGCSTPPTRRSSGPTRCSEETVERMGEEGVDAAGDTGEADPLLAIQDALADLRGRRDRAVHPRRRRDQLARGGPG